jgi:acyl carrier protein
MPPADLRTQISRLVVEAADGGFTAEDLERVNGSLEDAGMTSLAFLQFVELLEQRFGVIVDPEVAPDVLMNVTSIQKFIEDSRTRAQVA